MLLLLFVAPSIQHLLGVARSRSHRSFCLVIERRRPRIRSRLRSSVRTLYRRAGALAISASRQNGSHTTNEGLRMAQKRAHHFSRHHAPHTTSTAAPQVRRAGQQEQGSGLSQKYITQNTQCRAIAPQTRKAHRARKFVQNHSPKYRGRCSWCSYSMRHIQRPVVCCLVSWENIVNLQRTGVSSSPIARKKNWVASA